MRTRSRTAQTVFVSSFPMVPTNSSPEPGRVIRSIDPKLYYRYSSFVPATASELCPRIHLKHGDSRTNQPPVYGLSRERPNRRLPGTCKGLPYEREIGPQGRLRILKRLGKAFDVMCLPWISAIYRPDAHSDRRNYHLHLIYHDLPVYEQQDGSLSFLAIKCPLCRCAVRPIREHGVSVARACPSWPCTDEARAIRSHIRPLWYDVIRVCLLPGCYPVGRIGQNRVTRSRLSIWKDWLRG